MLVIFIYTVLLSFLLKVKAQIHPDNFTYFVMKPGIQIKHTINPHQIVIHQFDSSIVPNFFNLMIMFATLFLYQEVKTKEKIVFTIQKPENELIKNELKLD